MSDLKIKYLDSQYKELFEIYFFQKIMMTRV